MERRLLLDQKKQDGDNLKVPDYQKRAHKILYQMIDQKVLANKEWCEKEHALTIAYIVAQRNEHKEGAK